ncbi:MAG: nucleotide exchange factor GrpE [Patescibacteria group bacterium]
MSNEPQNEDDIKYETDPEGAENAAPKKAGFGKSESEVVADLKEKLAVALKEKQEYLDKWQRGTAEFQNARKRDQEDNDRFRKYAAENLITEILPVLESFNMAFSNKEAWEKVDKNWRVGVEYIASQLKGILEGNGLKELNPLGDTFDPTLHEAVEFKEVTEEKQNQKIVAVNNVGYSFNGRVIKAPKVVVGESKK